MDAVSARPMTRKQAILFFAVSVLLAFVGLAAWRYLPHHIILLGLFGAAACVAGLLAVAFPKYGLYFGLFYVYAGLSYYTNLPIAPAVTFLVAAAVVLGLLRGDSIQLRDPLFLWALAVFTVLVFQSFLFAYDYGQALSSFASFAKSMLIVFLIAQIVRKEEDVDRLALVLFAATLSAVVLGAVNIKLGILNEESATTSVMGWQRFSATFINANRAALFLVAGLPLGIYAVKRARPMALKLTLVVCVIAIVFATIMTFSRQTIFPLSVVLLAVLFREARSRWIHVVVLLVVAIVLLMIPQLYWHRISSITQIFEETSEEKSLAIRVKAFKTAWKMFLDHPFTGVGLNNFIVRSATDLPKRIGAHNAYLELLTGVGIFGFAAFMLMPVAAIRGYLKGIRTRWTTDRAWMGDASYYFMLSEVAILISLLFEHSHFQRVVWLPIVVGLIVGRLAGNTAPTAKKD